jgi:hypothetical protein
MSSRLRLLLPRLRRALRRRRHLLTALLVALLAALVVPPLLPAPLQTAQVVVAAHDLPVRSILTAGDLRQVRVARSLVPESSTSDPADLTGVVLPRPVLAGETLSPQGLRAQEEDGPDVGGMSVMAIPFEAALSEQLSVGAALDLHVPTTVPGETRTLQATVVQVPSAAAGTDDGALLSGADKGGADRTMLIATRPEDSGEIAHALHEGWLTISVNP